MKVRAWQTMALLFLLGVLMSPPDARADDLGTFVKTSIAVLLVLVIVFLIIREFVCWYWKQNEIVGLLREIRDALVSGKRKHVRQPTSQATEAPVSLGPVEVAKGGAAPVPAITESDTQAFCYYCGEPVSPGARKCTSCGKDLDQGDDEI